LFPILCIFEVYTIFWNFYWKKKIKKLINLGTAPGLLLAHGLGLLAWPTGHGGSPGMPACGARWAPTDALTTQRTGRGPTPDEGTTA
jgi:hypothetical protein